VTEGLRIVEDHLERLQPLGIKGSWLHGSLVLGGYHHGVSDQDLIVLLDHPLTDSERAKVEASHLVAGTLLAASYLEHPDDPEPWTWTHGWCGRRRVSLITRAELHLAHPDDWPEIPDVPGIVKLEVTKAWKRELYDPRTWLKTEYVDLSLTSIARARLTQQTGALCTKDDAIATLHDLVPSRLAKAIRARREGRDALPHNRFRRGWQTRNLVKRLLRDL
jgi:hypothetical protein